MPVTGEATWLQSKKNYCVPASSIPIAPGKAKFNINNVTFQGGFRILEFAERLQFQAETINGD